MKLRWTPSATRDAKRAVRNNPSLRARLEDTLLRLVADPFDPALHTHKLKGRLADRWACAVDYDNRVIFRFVSDADSGEQLILLLAVGPHDEVY